EQYCEVDDSYPHGVANPSLDAMLQELGGLVVKEKADLGIAIDADGDRIGAVDENGQMIYPDRMLVLLARNLLKSYPKSKIVFDVKSSQAVADDVKAHGGIPIMAMTGHSYIKQKVQETKAALGGERSGHMFFVKDWYGFDDACLAAARFLEYVSSESKRLSEIMQTVPKYYSSPVIHAPCPDEIKYDVLKKVVAFLKKKYPNVIDIDGAKVVFPDSWFLVRASSNMPVLVVGFEAKTKERLQELEQLVRKELANFPEIGKEWRNG
ncbi:MAG: phosphomannomutase/phosphoglucomutase, partial [Candidatus Diapherotrites archaeon]|nr:phosphomannomutase/phosphoglucomutase [Candidatus Diapherotrites archaeon]